MFDVRGFCVVVVVVVVTSNMICIFPYFLVLTKELAIICILCHYFPHE